MIIHVIRMGITRCYLIQDKGTILIDSGPPKKSRHFLKYMKRASLDPKQIRLIIHTHGHNDHIGSAKALKDITGAQMAMHEPDKEWLEKSLNRLPPGVTPWGKVLIKLIELSSKPQIAAASVDILLGGEDFPLAPFGIPGKVVYTPGHTKGSVTILLETGEAFVGDLTMNGFPFGLGPVLPVFAEDIEKVKESIRLLLGKGAKTFYPAHGKPFPAKIMSKYL